jgi:hypothetical protein
MCAPRLVAVWHARAGQTLPAFIATLFLGIILGVNEATPMLAGSQTFD